jgi:hypothetical protein
MARQPNQLKSVQITVSTTEPVKAYLEQLVPSGLYGKNAAEAAERLLVKAIDALIRDGSLPKRKK